MSLRDLVKGYVNKFDVMLTSAAGEGTTTLALYIAMILSEDKLVIYFNPSGDIDRNYVKRFYPRVYKNVLFIQSDLNTLLEFLNEIDYDFDHIILDPGDALVLAKKAIPSLKRICAIKKSHMIFTSQIRLDPKFSWQPYSTMERVNSKSGNTIFDYSIWVRRVSEDNTFFTSKYIDVFKGVRKGNQYVSRYLVKFDKTEGCMIT